MLWVCILLGLAGWIFAHMAGVGYGQSEILGASNGPAKLLTLLSAACNVAAILL